MLRRVVGETGVDEPAPVTAAPVTAAPVTAARRRSDQAAERAANIASSFAG
jgi:hypothetical protein